ncbi:MAG TPA: RDD family protein [Gaiellaceae bacterium]|nr:RDD family protein [Gaiellaceae bacterium]
MSFPPAPPLPHASQPVSGPSGPRATFWQRVGAILIDGVMLAVIDFVLKAISPSLGYLGILVGLAYFTYFEGGPTGQTIGKRIVGIRVYDFAQGGPIGYGRGVLRYLGRIVSTIPCLLGYFWMLWDKEKQTWHDKIATTVVVPVSSYPVQP